MRGSFFSRITSPYIINSSFASEITLFVNGLKGQQLPVQSVALDYLLVGLLGHLFGGFLLLAKLELLKTFMVKCNILLCCKDKYIF